MSPHTVSRYLTVEHQSWPIAGSFRISRGAKTAADVVVVEIVEDGARGRGECVPYARYGETVAGVVDAVRTLERDICDGLSRAELQSLMPPGAARNALDCALWDLEARQTRARVWELAGVEVMAPLTTAYTISLDTAKVMAEAAAKHAHRPLLKIKLGAEGDVERLRAVRAATPRARLIVDANEGWNSKTLEAMLAACEASRVELVEQPLPADDDAFLERFSHAVPVCADESVHGLASLDELGARYDAVNIKLDKTGGLTEALALGEAARERGLSIMVGCMLATSLAMAPAMVVAQYAAVVDLDGPLLLARDREPGIDYEGSIMHPPPEGLWG